MKLIVAMVSLAALLWTSVGAFAAEADNAPVPPQIRAARARHEAALKQAEAQWLRAQLAAKMAYLKEIQASLQDAMKAGKLDDANKIDAEKKRVETDIVTLRGRTQTGWTVIYRSSDPSIWNTETKGEGDRFATLLAEAPDNIKFLRMAISRDDFVIIPMTKDKLAGQVEYKNAGWRGNHWKNTPNAPIVCFGIYEKSWKVKKGGVEVGPGIVSGWGFGDRAWIHDKQCYAWAGKEIPPTVFEISVTEGPLNAEESKALLE